MTRRFDGCVRASIGILVFAAVLIGSSTAQAAQRHVVQKRVGPTGGLLRSSDGAALYVPPGVVRGRHSVSIRHRRGKINFHIAGEWRGTVGVTMPRVRRGEVVMHNVAGATWLPEGTPGQRTVWVTQLSWFDTAGAKAKAAVCFVTLSKTKVLKCLITKLGAYVSKKVALWIADKLGGGCTAALAIDAAAGGAGGVFLGRLFDPACVGHAGEENFHFPTGPAPSSSLPVITDPDGTQQQTANPQGPTTSPQPAPAPAPAPAFEPTYPVMNTSETPPDGVWFRNSPSSGDTDRVTGHGVYAGEYVKVRCYAWGESLGAFANRLWYLVTDVSRPTNAGRANDGYLNAHYINDGTVANPIVGGGRAC